MAKSKQTNVTTNRTARTWAYIIGIGAAVGLAYWVLTILLGRYIVEPLACRDVATAAACVDSTGLAGKIASVIMATISLLTMIRVSLFRPLLIVIAAAVLLWDLSVWTTGLFWVEALAWSVLLYALSYALFGWIARRFSLIFAIIIAAVLAVGIRLATSAV
jgi:hypothetical protein